MGSAPEKEGGEARTGVGAPFVDIDLGKTRDEQLEFPLRENLEHLLRHNLVQSLEESLHQVSADQLEGRNVPRFGP